MVLCFEGREIAETVEHELARQPILRVSELDALLKGIGDVSDFDMTRFDIHTRREVERGCRFRDIRDESI